MLAVPGSKNTVEVRLPQIIQYTTGNKYSQGVSILINSIKSIIH